MKVTAIRRFTVIFSFTWNIYSIQQLLLLIQSAPDPNENTGNQQKLDSDRDLVQSSEQFLHDYQQYVASTPSVVGSIHTQRIRNVESLMKQLVQLEQQDNQFITDAKIRKMKELERLLKIMLSGNDQTTNSKTSSIGSGRNMYNETLTAALGGVSMEEFERMFASEHVMTESETLVSDWIVKTITNEIHQLDINQYKSSIASTTTNGNPQNVKSISDIDTATCISVETTAVQVYHELLRYMYGDEIGLLDYTQSIVHEFTTQTKMENDENQLSTLHWLWWNRFIPQDWEHFVFPIIWQFWKVAKFLLPDQIFHSFVTGTPGAWYRDGRTHIAPPETILQTSIFPGHCWPITTSKISQQQQQPTVPMVTIRLQQPIVVTAITIDHTSKSLLSMLSKNPQQQLQSAPKRIKVYGYRPCNNENSARDCHGLGFDVQSKTLLTELTYTNEDGNDNIQTFPVRQQHHIATTTNHNHQHATTTSTVVDSDSNDESCLAAAAAASPESATESSCAKTNNLDVTSAITVEIIDNWGNTDYTCIYRVRVHGKPIR